MVQCVYGVFTVVATGSVLYGLYGDPSRDSKRCPACWYDMRGSERLVCPECGHDARNEKRLYKTRRRWWAVVLGCLMLTPWLYPAGVVWAYHREQQAVSKLASERGTFVEEKLHVPDWANRHVPPWFLPYYSRVVEVRATDDNWGYVELTDADLPYIGRLKHLESLGLQSTPISDSALRHIRGLSKLQELDLSMTSLTDDGLMHLTKLTSLRSVMLDGTRASDEAAAVMGSLPLLEELTMIETRVTDEGIKSLARSRSLRELLLNDTAIGDEGALMLGSISSLEFLDLSGTKVTDEAVRELKAQLPYARIRH